MPELYIITGSNGAGKSTVGMDYLPKHIQNSCPIFDGDKLFIKKRKELYPEPARTHKEARNLANEWLINHFEAQVDQALKNKNSFVYEGHFTSDSTWDVPKRFKENGYIINLIFFGLADPDLSEMRVVERSKSGGHYVSRIEIEFNFLGNLKKLNQYWTLFHSLKIVDTSEAKHKVLLQFSSGEITSAVSPKELPIWFKENLPSLADKISEEGEW